MFTRLKSTIWGKFLFLMAIIAVSAGLVGTAWAAKNCTDSDGGINYKTQGKTSFQEYDAQNRLISSGTAYDRCNAQYLREYYCDNNNDMQYQTHDCQGDCQDGACSASSSPTIDLIPVSFNIVPDKNNTTGPYRYYDGMSFEYTWKSDGDLPADAKIKYLVEFKINGVKSNQAFTGYAEIKDIDRPELPSKVNIQWQENDLSASDKVEWFFTLDYENAIAETNENNNTLTKTVTFPVDLVPVTFEVAPYKKTTDNPYQYFDNLSFKYTWKSSGDLPEGTKVKYLVEYKINGVKSANGFTGEAKIVDVDRPSIPAEVIVQWQENDLTKNDKVEWIFTLDPENVINETNKKNNVITETVTFKPAIIAPLKCDGSLVGIDETLPASSTLAKLIKNKDTANLAKIVNYYINNYGGKANGFKYELPGPTEDLIGQCKWLEHRSTGNCYIYSYKTSSKVSEYTDQSCNNIDIGKTKMIKALLDGYCCVVPPKIKTAVTDDGNLEKYDYLTGFTDGETLNSIAGNEIKVKSLVKQVLAAMPKINGISGYRLTGKLVPSTNERLIGDCKWLEREKSGYWYIYSYRTKGKVSDKTDVNYNNITEAQSRMTKAIMEGYCSEKPKAVPVKYNLTAEAALIYGSGSTRANLEKLTASTSKKVDTKLQTTWSNNCVNILKINYSLGKTSGLAFANAVNFVTYGSASVATIRQTDRCDMVELYIEQNNRFPENDGEWLDLLLAGDGINDNSQVLGIKIFYQQGNVYKQFTNKK